jgi:gas vesicle protein
MKDKTKKIAIGSLIAGVAGYVAGLLTAPKSGKETRKDIQNAAIKAKTEAEKTLKKLHNEITDLTDRARKNAEGLQGNVKEQAEKIITSGLSAKEKVREVLSSLHEGASDDKELKKALKQANEAVKHLKAYLAQYEKAVKDKIK